MRVRKINPDWYPQEHPEITVGDIVDFPGNVEQLVKEGSVEIVSDEPAQEPQAPTAESSATVSVETPVEESVTTE